MRTPTLRIAGSADPEVLTLNLDARLAIGVECRVSVVPGATHLFAEPGTLERAADLAADWFRRAFETAGLQPRRATRPAPDRSYLPRRGLSVS